jgi:hypothetical protein
MTDGKLVILDCPGCRTRVAVPAAAWGPNATFSCGICQAAGGPKKYLTPAGGTVWTPFQSPRIGDADRDKVIARLGEMLALGYIHQDEYDTMSDLALAARRQAELDVITADLPSSRPDGAYPIADQKDLANAKKLAKGWLPRSDRKVLAGVYRAAIFMAVVTGLLALAEVLSHL